MKGDDGEALRAALRSAEDAVASGDLPALEALLREHQDLFCTRRPPPSWLDDSLPADDSTLDARTILVRSHHFENWDQFAMHDGALKDGASTVARFERAVDAIVAGNAPVLEELLRHDPDLIRARSIRRHHSMLLHYVGANGVEAFRQRTPPNAVQMAEMLLEAGADVDAVADMYGGGCTTLGLVATSIHPKVAGVLHALIDVLLAHGARLESRGAGRATPLVNGCLANGRGDAAEFLASRGAPLDLEAAAGVGRLDLVKSFFNPDGSLAENATASQMKDGFTWACEYGRTHVVEYLLDRGIDAGERLSRPHGQTGLHWAAYGGHLDTVNALLRRRAPLDVKDGSFGGTPLGWALHRWNERKQEGSAAEAWYAVVACLVAAGAPVEADWLDAENVRADPRMSVALRARASS